MFYRSWLDAIKNLPREMQGEVLTAIIEYGLDGVTTGSLKPITSAMLELVKPQIEANNKRLENGMKGGRPKKEKQTENEPDNNQVLTEEKPKNNQKITKEKPKVKDKVEEKEISLSRDEENYPSHDYEEIDLVSCYEAIRKNDQWRETITMNTRSGGHGTFSRDDFERYLFAFFRKLENEGEKTKSVKDAMSHFARWLRIELDKTVKNEKNRRSYTSKQEANDYVVEQYIADRERLEQGLHEEIPKPF